MAQPLTRTEWRKREKAKRDAENAGKPEIPRRRPNLIVPMQSYSETFTYRQIDTRASNMRECGVCCETLSLTAFRRLTNCKHAFCELCLKTHVRYAINESRIEIPCPACPVKLSPIDIRRFCQAQPQILSKFEEFSLRAVLVKNPDARWCPAPDCGFAAIIPNGSKCPKITCLRPGCGTDFCFDCKKEWHPNRSCEKITETAILARENGPPGAPALASMRPCPRCRTPILKEDDGSCNHMICTMCRAEFCWLCLNEITDLHYLSPTGCTFWGRKPWSGKKRLLVQLGSLIGSPVLIAATALVSVPIIIGIVPISIGKKVYRKMAGKSKAKQAVATVAAVTGSAVVAPALATFAVAIGVPFAIGYTYVVVPKALITDAIDYFRRRNTPIPENVIFEDDLNADGSGPSSSKI